MMLKYIAIIPLFLSVHGYAISKSKKASLAFAHASQLQKSSRYEEALLEFQEIERTFPYSKFAKASKLKIADIHFDMSNYVQAQYQYQYYFDLYPKDSDSDYALYRVGLSLYKLLPKTVDRDLGGTAQVLKAWRNVLVKFPKSKFTDEILTKQKKLINNLGSKELYIAAFYTRRGKCISATKRIKKLFREFPSFLKNKQALNTALKCSKELGDNPATEKYSKLLETAS
jgi:outer membrane protein assembly factor BamD